MSRSVAERRVFVEAHPLHWALTHDVLALCSCRRCALCYLIFIVFFVFIFWIWVLAVVVDLGFDMALELLNELIFPDFVCAGGARVWLACSEDGLRMMVHAVQLLLGTGRDPVNTLTSELACSGGIFKNVCVCVRV